MSNFSYLDEDISYPSWRDENEGLNSSDIEIIVDSEDGKLQNELKQEYKEEGTLIEQLHEHEEEEEKEQDEQQQEDEEEENESPMVDEQSTNEPPQSTPSLNKLSPSEEYLQIDINLSLLETKQSPELYGFSYPEINPNQVEEQIAFSVTDLTDLLEIKTKFYPIKHQFIAAAYEAFDKHYGFVLSPSQLFLLILQQISIHQYSARQQKKQTSSSSSSSSQKRTMNEEIALQENSINALPETVLQRKYQPIEIEFDLSPEDDEFHQIIENIRQEIRLQRSSALSVDSLQTLNCCENFSVITEEEVIAMEACFLNQQEEFFHYQYAPTRCGIPYFRLVGNLKDWEDLYRRAEEVIQQQTSSEFSLKWLPIILPVLDRLLKTKQRNSSQLGLGDLQFWRNFVKIGEIEGSGAHTFITGWINAFFPLTAYQKWNESCLSYDAYTSQLAQTSEQNSSTLLADGTDIRLYPMGLSSIPVDWNYHFFGDEVEQKIIARRLHFFSGFIGVKIEEHHLRPLVGWWISLLLDKIDSKHKEKNHFKEMEKEFGSIFES